MITKNKILLSLITFTSILCMEPEDQNKGQKRSYEESEVDSGEDQDSKKQKLETNKPDNLEEKTGIHAPCDGHVSFIKQKAMFYHWYTSN